MNVKQLKEELSKYPDNMQILISSDEEGNGFNRLYELAESMWLRSDWDGDQIYVMPEMIGTHGYTEEDRAPEGAEKVLVLWP